MANLIQYNGKSKIIKRICELLNEAVSPVQDVKVNGDSVVDENGIANVETPTLGTGAENAYYGDKGESAYQHSLLTSGNPHHVTARDLGLDTLQDQINALAEAIGTRSDWASHSHGLITDHEGNVIQFQTASKLLAYH